MYGPRADVPTNLTSRAEKVLADSEAQARRLRRTYVQSEHLLLGLLHQKDGAAVVLLDRARVTRRLVKQTLAHIGPKAEARSCDDRAPLGFLPFSQEVHAALHLAEEESLRRRDYYVGTGHLLFGVLGQYTANAFGLLLSLGVDLDRLRDDVVASLAEHPEEPEPSSEDVQRLFNTWEDMGRKCPELTDYEERRLAIAIAKGLMAREVLSEGVEPHQEGDLRQVVEASHEAFGRLLDSNFRLVPEVARPYREEPRVMPQVFAEALKALHEACSSIADWHGNHRFADEAKGLMKYRIDERLNH